MNEVEIKKKFGNKLVGTKRMQYFVVSVLSKMPDEIINYISKNAWFLGSLEDAWARYVPVNIRH